jgi:hypothetical protein
MDATTLLASMAPATCLEAAMLVCFGVAWPVATVRMWLRRRAEGQGLAFTGIILCGYAAGAGAKLVDVPSDAGLAAMDPVLWLYLVNLVWVAANLALQWHFGRTDRATPKFDERGAPVLGLGATE